jgi:hypothetical protein
MNAAMRDRQTSNAVLMVRPACFGFHAEAAISNAFAMAAAGGDGPEQAIREFDAVVEQLGRAGVELFVLPDAAEPAKPDAVFPNNWVSFHGDGTVVLYPMATAARRLERDPARLIHLLEGFGCEIVRVVDLSGHELLHDRIEFPGRLRRNAGIPGRGREGIALGGLGMETETGRPDHQDGVAGLIVAHGDLSVQAGRLGKRFRPARSN